MGNFDNKRNNGEGADSSRAKIVGLTKTYTNQLNSNSRIYDPTIISRLNKYLVEHKDQTYVNLEGITEALRSRYREYRRRNWNDFKKLVERAFAELSKNAGIDAIDSVEMDSIDSSGLSEVEECDSNDAVNNSNLQVTGLYKNNRKSGEKGREEDMELINLSSDDEPRPSAASKDDSENEPRIPNSLLRIPDISVSRRRRVTQRAQQEDKTPAKVMSSVTFADFAGSPAILQEVCQLMVHVKHPELFQAFGMSAPRGFLLHGPPGCGKTLLASAIAGELKVPFIKVCGPELVGGVSGESEERVRELFATALMSAPCVLFIDEVDAITPNRQTAQREMERRIVAQLISSLDDLSEKDKDGQVLVIGATKRPDALDPALRRAGRFDREVCLGIPNEKAREDILRVLCTSVPLSQDLQLSTVARMTPGFVGSDLLSLVRESAMVAITRVLEVAKLENEENSVDTATRKRKRGPETDVPLKKRILKCKSELVQQDVVLEKDSKDDKSNSEPIEVVAVSSSVSDGKAENGEPASAATTTPAEAEAVPVAVAVVSNGVEDVTMVDALKESKGDTVEIAIDVENADEISDVIDAVATNACASDKDKTDPLTSLLKLIRSASKLKGEELSKLQLEQEDVMKALKTVQPSAKREGFATVPGVTWEDVGSLVAIREHLKMTILGPVKYATQFERLGLVTPAGVLLCGPPGCGKTLLAKAVANEAGINFISVKGPELLNMYVGESERAVRTVFQRARNSTPCVIFFDELDALCPRRSEGDAGAGMRVVNQMLTEMDGVGERRGVFLMAATNRPDIVDPAVLRPGRLDRTIYIGLPSPTDRKDILRAITKNGTKPPLASDVSLDEVAARAELNNWTGADLAALMREAAMQSMRDALSGVDITADVQAQGDALPADVAVTAHHIDRAITRIRPSVSPKDLKRYEEMRLQFEASQ